MPPPKLPQLSGAVHSIWWLGIFFFFFDLFSYSGLRAFFTSDFMNCTTDYAPPQITPTIRCCSQHLMVGFFFFDIFSYSGLRAFFTSDFTNCTTDYAPPKLTQPSGAVHSIWWLEFFFFDLFSYSGLRAFFTSDFTNCTTDYAPQINPTIRCCSQHLMVGFFFLISSPILDLEHFSQVIYKLYYRLCPPQITPTIRCCSQHLMVGVFFFFFDLFSYSGLRAFFTSDFTNCTTDYAPPKLNHQVLFTASDGWGFFFFLTFSPILDLEHFSQVILRIVLQIMPPKLTQPSGAVHSI